jgi:polysaccharide pyruvyl transferase WcaK-like protein
VIDTEIGSLEVDNVDLGNRPLRIALFGQYGIDNFGNEAAMEAMLHFLRRECPDAQLTVICPQPDVVERTYSVAAIRTNLPGRSGRLFRLFDLALLRLPRTADLFLRTIRKARGMDLLIAAGTGLLEEPSHRLSRMHWTLLLWCAAARITGKKIAFVSIGAAPINNAVVRRLLTTALRMGHYRSFRDETSKRCASEVFGLNVEGDQVYPDIVFGLPGPAGLARSPRNDHSLSIGLGLMSFWFWYGEDVQKAYIDKLVDFSLSVVRQGHHIRLLVADKVDYGTVENFIHAINEKDPSLLGKSIIAEQMSCTQDVMRQIALTDVVIGSRYHNIIYALMLGKPVISIGYSAKHRALLEEFGLGKFIQAVQQIDAALLQDQFLDLLKNREAYERRIQQALSRFQELREQQERTLSARFLGVRRA